MMTTDFSRRLSAGSREHHPSESDCYSLSTSPTSTMSIASLQEARLREDMELGRHSPRAAVAGRFGQLAIRGERPGERELQNPDLAQNNMLEAHESSLGDIQEDLPASEPADTHAVFDVDMQPQPGSPPTSTDRLSTPPATSPKKKRTPSRKPTVRASPSKNRKKRFSPPPPRSSLEDPFTWHDYEITGHDPSDPTDDGYGINGVGFKPTAAMAWARSQKRQKQVLEWKNREAREAREKRRERRDDGVNLDPIHSIRQGSIQKRVKFDV